MNPQLKPPQNCLRIIPAVPKSIRLWQPGYLSCYTLAMGLSQRKKGERGERWLRDKLRARGYHEAVRTRQRHGSSDSPDVLEHYTPIHWEMKWGYPGGLSIRAVLAKAAGECETTDGVPVGVWKPPRQPAIAFLYLDDFLDLVKKAYEPS